MDGLKLLVIAALLAIVISLGAALYHLATDKGGSNKLVRALTLRIGLSIALFIVLMLAWWAGYISPHGIVP